MSLLRRKLAQNGHRLSLAQMMERLSEIHEVTLLYPAPPGEKAPFVRTLLSSPDETQRALLDALELQRYQSK